MNTVSIYEAVMAERFQHLDEAVRAFHQLQGRHVLHGWVETEAPARGPAGLFARIMGTPVSRQSGAIRFELDAGARQELWVRHFPANTMRSHMRLHDGELHEVMGPARLRFALDELDGRLRMRIVQMRVFGVPCPRWAMPDVFAEESGTGDKLHFAVRVTFPLIGQVAGYRGHLELPKESGT